MMLGAIAGDIIGSIFEYQGIKSKRFELFEPERYFTDDTVLTVALADTILTGMPYKENLKAYFYDYPDRGYGMSFIMWATSDRGEPYNSWGNGAAMRISPTGYAYNELETVLNKAGEFTAITHNHIEGIKGGRATAAAVFLARTGSSKEEIKEYIEETFGYDLSRHIDDIRPIYEYDISSQGTVPQAIRSVLDSSDYEDAIRNAVSLGGDADTLACITGGIAEAFYGGIPKEIREKAYSILDDKLASVVKEFAAKHCSF